MEDTFDWYCKNRSRLGIIVDTRETAGDGCSPTSVVHTSTTTATSTFHTIRETMEDCSSPTTNTTSFKDFVPENNLHGLTTSSGTHSCSSNKSSAKRKPVLRSEWSSEESTKVPVASVWKWRPREQEKYLDRAIPQNNQEPSEHFDTEDESWSLR